MRIVFMGTPDFAVPSLKKIHEKYTVVAVITAPDKPAGRGKKMKTSAVKDFAVGNNIKVLQPVNLKDPVFVAELKKLNADLQVVVAFRMLPEIVWSMPVLGTINLHGSLLPQYRGAAPINRAIMNGETKTGVSTFFLKQEIDTGNVIMQREISIDENETAGELHDRMMEIGAQCLLETLEKIGSGKAEAKPQEEIEPTGTIQQAPKIFKEDCKIEWNSSSAGIHNFIRGLSPFPGAFSILKNSAKESIIKIYKSLKTGLTSEEISCGSLKIIDGKLLVACEDYFLEIIELQLAGKKRMSAEDFLRGNSLSDDAYLI